LGTRASGPYEPLHLARGAVTGKHALTDGGAGRSLGRRCRRGEVTDTTEARERERRFQASRRSLRVLLMTVALPRPEDPLDSLLPGSALRVGRGNGVPPLARGGNIAGVAKVDVRPPRNTEPPVLLALPALQPELLTAPGHP
jgi:hypothetical protein